MSVDFDSIQREIPELDLTMGGAESTSKLIERSSLLDNEERAEKWKVVSKNSKWTGNAVEFSYLCNNSDSDQVPDDPVVLGLTFSDTDPYAVIAASTENGETFFDAYDGYDIDDQEPDHTEKFLKKLAAENRQIIFLVPPNLYNYDLGKITKDEMDWFLDNPELARNVYFVFGAYDFIDKSWHEKQMENHFRENSDSVFEDYIADKLKDWTKKLLLK